MSGQYLSKHGECHLCDITCERCTGPEREDCTSCPPTRLYEEGKCVIRCQLGRYPKEGLCSLCHHTCQACTDDGPDTCTSCDTDRLGVTRYLFQNQCREVCPEGFYQSARMRCDPCPADCTVCAAADHCLQCSPGHMLRHDHCVPLECSTGEASDVESEACFPCDDGCEKCKLNDSGNQEQKTVCLQCEEGYYQLGPDCHQSCPDRTYSDNNNMVCAPCPDEHCAVCDQSQCYWCDEAFYVFDGECVKHCEEGYFVDEEGRECEPCHRSCHTCGGPQYDDCDSCKDGFVLKNGECQEDKRFAACPENHFKNDQGQCEQCHSSCKTCFAAGMEDCSSCHSGYFMTSRQTCLSQCPSGTFANKTSGQCKDCLEGCVVCHSSQVCQQCRSGLYRQDGACVVECQRGFPEGDGCQPCAPACSSCIKSPTHCLSCEKDLLLLDHSCISRCPEGYYANSTECHPCPAHCSECNQDGLCKNCAHYFFLHEGECVDDCPAGYFSTENECVGCHVDCASCDGPGFDDCSLCRNPKAVLYHGECLPKCPDSSYYEKTTKECKDCDKSCLTCSGHGPSDCLSCDAKKHKDASEHCVWDSQCSPGSYLDQNGECQQCHPLCQNCSGPNRGHCLSCKTPRLLLNNTCVKSCPLGYYAEKNTELSCELCHFGCKSCVGRHSQQCVTCKTGFFKHGGSCVETCPLSHFKNMNTMACQQCDPSCRQCSGPGNQNCLKCRNGFVFLKKEGRCLHSCPEGYFVDRQSVCHKCHPTCKTCNREGGVACLSCYDGFTFLSGICENPCFLGFYPDPKDSKSVQTKCKACDPSCEACRGPSMWDCSVCSAAHMMAEDGRCLRCCGHDTLRNDEPLPRECCDCKASQMECVLGVNFVMVADEVESTAKLFVTVWIFVILFLGVALFLFLSARSKLATRPKTKTGGYERVDTNGGPTPQATTSSLKDYDDKIAQLQDGDEEDDDEDIVYMTKDGTVYRKFKYGLLDEDDNDLEYDDESYTLT